LKAQIATLIAKGKCEYHTPVDIVLQLLREEYNVEPAPETVEGELIEIHLENTWDEKVNLADDWFQGY
jgi:hypothetical protein